MRGSQIERGVAQAVSSVALRREAERIARKNEEDVWRRRDTGVQLRKVELERNLVKKEGQEGAVKLLPMDVSNGKGSGVVMTVTDGEESEDVDVGISVSVVGDPDVDVDDARFAVGSSASNEELEDSKRSCLRSRCPKGAGIVSTCISPLVSNSLKCAESAARGATGTSYAEASVTMVTRSVSSDMVIESRSIGRLLPGRGLCGDNCMVKVLVLSTVGLFLPSAATMLRCYLTHCQKAFV